MSDALYAAAVAPDDRESERHAMECALGRTDDVYNCTYRLDGVDGVQRTVASTGHGFFNDDGSLAYFIGVLERHHRSDP